jgi:hypothetical protein
VVALPKTNRNLGNYGKNLSLDDFDTQNFEIGNSSRLARGGIDALDAHLFQHPLAVDFFGGGDAPSFFNQLQRKRGKAP